MEKFAAYGFNKSHSAAYGLLTVQTAWLKAHYPVEFMAALISSEASNTDKVVLHVAEARADGIEVLPPDVNESGKDFAAFPARMPAQGQPGEAARSEPRCQGQDPLRPRRGEAAWASRAVRGDRWRRATEGGPFKQPRSTSPRGWTPARSTRRWSRRS